MNWLRSQLANYWLTIILIVLVGVSIAQHCNKTLVTDSSLVLTFIGILATFVVVSNYAQVRDVEKKCDERIKELSDKLDKILSTGRLSARENFNYLKAEIYKHKSDEDKKRECFKQMGISFSDIEDEVLIRDVLHYMKVSLNEIERNWSCDFVDKILDNFIHFQTYILKNDIDGITHTFCTFIERSVEKQRISFIEPAFRVLNTLYHSHLAQKKQKDMISEALNEVKEQIEKSSDYYTVIGILVGGFEKLYPSTMIYDKDLTKVIDKDKREGHLGA